MQLFNSSPSLRSQAIIRQLKENEVECLRHNVVVRVLSMGMRERVMFCTVEQRLFGLFRRRLCNEDLIYRAQQALAPLCGLGLLPMVDVVHPVPVRRTPKRLRNRWPATFWRWLGSPLAYAGYKDAISANDPFGWRKAAAVSL